VRGALSERAVSYPVKRAAIPARVQGGIKRVGLLRRGIGSDYLALPVHHKTLPMMRHSDSGASEMDSYSRRSETKTSV